MKDKKHIKQTWLERLMVRRDGHMENVKKFGRRNKQFGIPTIVVSAIVGSAVFATLGESDMVGLQIAAGILSLSGAALSSLQTFLGYDSLSEKNHAAAAGYSRLISEVEARTLLDKPDDEEFVTDFVDRMNTLIADSPPLPTSALGKLKGLGDSSATA